jgi:hypothetical protein
VLGICQFHQTPTVFCFSHYVSFCFILMKLLIGQNLMGDSQRHRMTPLYPEKSCGIPFLIGPRPLSSSQRKRLRVTQVEQTEQQEVLPTLTRQCSPFVITVFGKYDIMVSLSVTLYRFQAEIRSLAEMVASSKAGTRHRPREPIARAGPPPEMEFRV